MVTCASQSVVSPNTTTIFGCEVNGKRKAVQLNQNQMATLEWHLIDVSGASVDLTTCGTFVDGDADTGSVKLTVVESTLRNACLAPVVDQLVGSVTDLEGGVVRFETEKLITARAGIYLAEAAVFNTDGDMIFSNQFYVVVNRGLTGTRLENLGPPSVAEIRLHLRDSDAAENELLENVEFDLAEIAICIEKPVLYWNESLPPINQIYSTDTFPFRYHWLEGIVAHLYFIAAAWYRRNHLAYTAGGVQVDDMNKSQEYEQIGQLRWNTYREWVLKKKVQFNAESAIQSQNSGYVYW